MTCPPPRASKVAALETLYASMPGVKCKGLCASECTSISMSDLEHQRVADAGTAIPRPSPANLGKPCPALKDGRCTVYEVRPFICRIYGATSGTAVDCKHGCEIEGRPWTNTEVIEGLALSYLIGGGNMRKQQQDAAAVIMLARAHPDGRRIVDLAQTPQGRLQLAKEQFARTVFNPLPRGNL